MPPSAANTAKPRTSGVSASRNVDTDDEYLAYHNWRKEAEAMRSRLIKATQDRDENGAALQDALEETMAGLTSHVRRSMRQYKLTRSIAHQKQLTRYKQAIEARNQKLQDIATKLVDLRQIMANHCVQLEALYEDRVAEMNEILKSAAKESDEGKSKLAGTVEATNAVEDQAPPAE